MHGVPGTSPHWKTENSFSSFIFMASSTKPIMELASSFHKHICMRFLGDSINLGLIHRRATMTFAEENPIWKSGGASFNSLGCEGVYGLGQGYGISISVKHKSNAYASLLQGCNNITLLKQVHAQICTIGLEQHSFWISKLMRMYAMYSNMECAHKMFDRLHKPDIDSWNLMIRGYARNEPYEEVLTLYHQMRQEGIQSDNFTFPFVLKACARLSALRIGQEIHAVIIGIGFESDVFVGNPLISMYAKCGCIEFARQMLDGMPKRDVVSWNAMLVGYAQNGYANEALKLFNQMHLANMTTSSVTMASLIQACAHLGALPQGQWIHEYINHNAGFEWDVFVGSSLITMYAKCGSIDLARQVFDKMRERDVVVWNAMIDGYVENGHIDVSLALFHEMRLAQVTPDSVTMLSVAQACAHSGALRHCKWIHAYIIKRGFDLDDALGTTLIDMYGKCGSIEVARQLFDKMLKKNFVSWTAMIAGYAQLGCVNEALTLFYQMRLTYVKPDSITIVHVLLACLQVGALRQSKWVHGYIIKSGFESDVVVETNLINLYAKYGSITTARQMFDEMSKRDAFSWNAMIAGYAQNGHAIESVALLNQMQLQDMKPNSVTMVSVLPAFSDLAILHRCKWIHGYIIKRGFESDVHVGNSLIDMYGKGGSIDFASRFFNKMPIKDVVSWTAMIAGYGMHGYGDNALALFWQMQQIGMQPDGITFVCVLSACSHAGLVDKGWKIFDSMIQDCCITPKVEHYACMVDLFGRSGFVDKARDFIEKMPLEPSISVWGALLNACRIYNNTDLGVRVAEHLLDLKPENSGCYVLLSNIYAAAGRWDDVAKVRTMMKERGLKKTPGFSSIEVNNKVHTFFVGDKSHPESEKIYAMLDSLYGELEAVGYLPNTNFVLHDVEEETKEHMLYSHSEKLAIAFGLINTSLGTPIRITKNLRVCGDCHSATKLISKIVCREIIVRDANRFHHFKDGSCSCGDYW